MSGHTPGPWRWEGSTLLGPEDNNAYFDDCMCRLVIGCELEHELDKRLIAAAPELLSAVHKMLKAHVRFGNSDYDTRYNEAIAALQNAESRTRVET